MRNYDFTNNGKHYTRISKKKALSAYMDGKTIVICAVNIRPFNGYGIGYTTLNRKARASFHADEIGARNDFFEYIGSFEYYNCKNAETGKYSAFYAVV